MPRLSSLLRLLPLAAMFALSTPTIATAAKKKVVKKKVVKKKTTRRRRKPKPSISEPMLAKGTPALVLGVAFASLKDDHRTGATEQDYGTEPGLILGARYDKVLNRFLGYRMAVQYHGKGMSVTSGNQTTEATLGYLEIPAALFARFPVNRMITPYIYFGPYVAALVSAEVKVDGEKNKDLKDNYSFLDYGLHFGAGSYFAISKGLMASVEMSYHAGFADVIDHDAEAIKASTLTDDDATNTTSFAITGAIHF